MNRLRFFIYDARAVLAVLPDPEVVPVVELFAEEAAKGVVFRAGFAELGKREEVGGGGGLVEVGFDVLVKGEEVGTTFGVFEPFAEEGEVFL